MSRSGYYMHPAIHGETVVFASDDDLWAVPAGGGLARRLTDAATVATRPSFSPDGSRIAYLGVEEGYPEVYVMPAEGGPGLRLTRLAAPTLVLAWTPDGTRVVYSTIRGQKNHRLYFAYAVPDSGGRPEPVPVGPVTALDFGPGRGRVIGRGSGMDPAWWKRYRGGRAGEIWIDRDGSGEFRKLIETGGNLANPLWLGGRIWFQSDHEGVGNLYSCTPEGSGLRRHTDHADYYLRSLSRDAARLVYAAGGDLWLFDPAANASRKIEIDFPSPKARRARRFVHAERFLEEHDLHPDGHSLCLVARGKPFVMGLWEGAAREIGTPGGRVRYRLARWLKDGKRVVLVSDEGGEEALEVWTEDGRREKRLDGLDVGFPVTLQPSPVKDEVLLSNHRGELLLVDLAAGTSKVLEASRHGRIAGHDWSPDGRFVAWGSQLTSKTGGIVLLRLETGEKRLAAEPVLRDVSPAFDPDGKHLYFLSYSGFEPVRDVLDFAYAFPLGVQVKLVTLRKDLLSPFVPQPKAPGGGPPAPAPAPPAPAKAPDARPAEALPDGKPPEAPPPGPKPVEIDFEGIERRVAVFPLGLGNFGSVAGLPGGKVLYLSYPLESARSRSWMPGEPDAKASLMLFDFEKGRPELLVAGLSDFTLCARGKVMAYLAGRRLRAVPAGAKPAEEGASEPPSRRNGWIDLSRLKVSVEPGEEWKQMFREAWRLLREHYYSPDMGGCDWKTVYDRYAPLVERVSARRELSDLIWEMGGELGTSHAYELGGDYSPFTLYLQGFLGADFEWTEGGWRIARILCGDPGELDSPLNAPGIRAKEGDLLLAVNGVPAGPSTPPEELLVNLGHQEVALTLQNADGERTVTVRALAEDMPLRHRAWVLANAERVHRETGGRVGYIHLTDMSPQGFSEFHRAFLTEGERDALIVDVRYNMGGHVSPLILQRLMRPRVGYNLGRWSDPSPKPPDSFTGPMVCLTDEFAGSDGDVFSHTWKQLGLGPLIGRRTWGGIVGLHPTHRLVDGTVTTQPEFFNWLLDVGYGLENRGAVPDIPVEIAPQDYVAGRDPQLDRALEVVTKLLEANPPERPEFGTRPDRSLPKLPPRS